MVDDRHDLVGRERSVGLRGERREGRQVDEADGVAVGLGVDEMRPADLAVGAGKVVDDQRLADILFGFHGKKTSTGVGAAL